MVEQGWWNRGGGGGGRHNHLCLNGFVRRKSVFLPDNGRKKLLTVSKTSMGLHGTDWMTMQNTRALNFWLRKKKNQHPRKTNEAMEMESVDLNKLMAS